MIKPKKQIVEKPVVFCRDCEYATPDMKFENLSLAGKPTLLKCSIHTERKRIISEEGCNDFKRKAL